ncbi:cellulase family glycosylhydrolase [Nocardioidaceae bacterium]|nr:cellulase family glycosylhydrolase [Nocardioidaceae bacterium]
MRRLTALLGALALLVVGVLGVRALASPTTVADVGFPRCAGPMVGAQVHAIWSDVDSESRAEILDGMVELGVRTVRIDVSWAQLEPVQFEYDQEAVDRLQRVVDQVTERGLDPLVMLWLTPGWANSDRGERVPPSDPIAYGQIMAWAVQRFPEVRDWQVWNEPNSEDFLVGADPVAYAGLLEEAFHQAHRARGDVRIIFGGTSYQDTSWIEQVYAAGAHGHFDVMSTHAYQAVGDEPPELEAASGEDSQYRLRGVEAVRELMVANGDARVPVWFTEFGWSAFDSPEDATGTDRGVTEAEQADYLVRALRLMREEYPYVERAYWYNARDRDSGDERIDSFGLLRRDLTPKPVAEALTDYLRGCG